jgi:hypothetical protein
MILVLRGSLGEDRQASDTNSGGAQLDAVLADPEVPMRGCIVLRRVIIAALLIGQVTIAQAQTSLPAPVEATISHINDLVYHNDNAFSMPHGFRSIGIVVAVQNDQGDSNLVRSSTRGAALTVGRRYLGTVVLRDPVDSSKTLACFVGVSGHDPEMVQLAASGMTTNTDLLGHAYEVDGARKGSALASLHAGSVVTVTGWDATIDPMRKVAMYGCDLSVGGTVEKAAPSAATSAATLEDEFLHDFDSGNGDAFERRYDGKMLTVTGRVWIISSVDQVGDGTLTPTLAIDTEHMSHNNDGTKATVNCTMAPGVSVSGLQRGSQVTIAGRYRRHSMGIMGGSLAFDDCALQR